MLLGQCHRRGVYNSLGEQDHILRGVYLRLCAVSTVTCVPTTEYHFHRLWSKCL
jgi:hypothetical protein